jgi:anti-anti-sigma regulatory factor
MASSVTFCAFGGSTGTMRVSACWPVIGLTLGVPSLAAQSSLAAGVTAGSAKLSDQRKFREVVLDFSGVNTIGQAFADEIFRVFQQLHPEVKLRWFNANNEVDTMIKRAIAQRDLAQLSVFDQSDDRNSRPK